MLTDQEINEFYDSLQEYFIEPDDTLIDMALNNKKSNILVSIGDKRILAVTSFSASVRTLLEFDKQVVYSYVFDGMKGIQSNVFSKNKCWRMRITDDGYGWNDSPNIENYAQLYDYILLNQKAALLDKIYKSINHFRTMIMRGTRSQQNVYFAKFMEAREIIDNNVEEDLFLKYPFTTGYADSMDISLQEAAKKIMFSHNNQMSRLAENENMRLKFSNMVRDEEDIKNLKGILDNFNSENYSYANL
jgi:hypothetical protein